MVESRWVVCKFGGTSVSKKSTWAVIVRRVKELRSEGCKVCIIVSAVSQVTNNLEKVVAELSKEQMKNKSRTLTPTNSINQVNVKDTYNWIYERHEQLCKELAIPFESVLPLLRELERLIEGIRLTGDSASTRLRAKMLSFGELLSSHAGVEALKRDLPGCNVGIIDARDILIASNSMHDNILVNPADKYLNADITPFRLDLDSFDPMDDGVSTASAGLDPRCSLFADHDVVISQGFIASTAEGQTCVLGRGGSDTSGALFAAILGAVRCEIWTDVDGMFSADPRHVPNAHILEELSYREAQELAAMGAKVLHPRCLGPASWANIPVEIHNTMKDHQTQFTRIVAPEVMPDANQCVVMAIARRTGQVLITISNIDMWGASGFLSSTFEPFTTFGISVDLIATSQYAVSMTLDYIPGGVGGEPFSKLLRKLRARGRVEVQEDCAVVSIVGRKLRSMLDGMAGAFKELGRHNVLLLSESTEDLNLSFVLASGELVDDLVLKLHNVLLEGGRKERSNSAVSPRLSPVIHALQPPVFTLSDTHHQAPQAVVTASLSNLSTPIKWWEEETVKQVHRTAPYVIIDVASVNRVASRLKLFSLTWNSQPAVLRGVYASNSQIVFVCRAEEDVLHLRGVLDGSGIRVVMKATLPRNFVFPGGMTAITMPNIDEEIVRSSVVLADCRILAANVIGANHPSSVNIDTWFKNVGGTHKITILNPMPSNLKGVHAIMPFDDISEKLFEITDAAFENTCTCCTQIVISGFTGTAFNVNTKKPLDEIVRY